MEVFLFVPGFFGFGSFGHPDRPFIEYFARVEDALLRAHVRPARFVVHQPPPAGSLAGRARSLYDKAAEVLRSGATRLHLVGHSTGGLDARLLANSAYADLPERTDLIARVGSLITVSAPFHGTPLANRGGGAAWVAAPALWFGSILASRRRLRLAGQVAGLVNLAKRATFQSPSATDQVIAQLADVDEDTADQIRRFLGDVARDHRLIDDLTPGTMAALNRKLAGADAVRPRSFVSVAPRASLSPRAFLSTPLQRLLYDVMSRLTAGPPVEGSRIPIGPWIGHGHMPLLPASNDGVVPAWSQTLDGQAAGLVLGDHLDVIGHSKAAGATFLRSGSNFDEARFRALWSAVARAVG
ncbi:MAG: esterase/lipase family protein [Myxococcales bacterium]